MNLIYLFLISFFAWSGQSDILSLSQNNKSPEQVKSDSVEIEGIYLQDEKEVGYISGVGFLTLRRINYDNSVEARVEITISESSRNEIADKLNLLGESIPERLEIKEALFELENKKSNCPRMVIVALSQKGDFFKGKITLKSYSVNLNIEDKSEELKHAFCVWERMVKNKIARGSQAIRVINKKIED